MALTIGEASDVNVLLEHALNLSGPTGVPSSEKAREAAARLADKASKTLLAGLDGDRVRAAWPEDNDNADEALWSAYRSTVEERAGRPLTDDEAARFADTFGLTSVIECIDGWLDGADICQDGA